MLMSEPGLVAACFHYQHAVRISCLPPAAVPADMGLDGVLAWVMSAQVA